GSGSQRLTGDNFGERIVDVDPKSVAAGGPAYDRPYARPTWQDDLNADRAEVLPRPTGPGEIAEQIRALIASPNLADKSWVTDQYASLARGNTAQTFPDDAGVVRVEEESGLGIALAADANGR